MSSSYKSCLNLVGSPVCGANVTKMTYSYYYCSEMYGNSYFYSPNVSTMTNCFYGRNTANVLSIYTVANSTTMNTILINNTSSLVGAPITWTDDTATTGCYYNTAYNIYIYPVEDVAAARTANGD